MNVICRSIGVASAMILWAFAASKGLVSERAFDMGFYALIAATVLVIGRDRCRLTLAN